MYSSKVQEDMYPLVSVAIPVYNGENYMRDAINSVLAQTYSNFEVLVVNDGSRDGGTTEEIALSYGDRIRYFSKPNGGVASALNLALKEAKGEYFCWLSHDDVYLPDKVAKEMEKLLSLPDPNSVVFCRYSIINSDGQYLYDAPLPPQFPPHQAAYQLILKQWLHCCTILAPTSLYLESGSFREDLPTTQDYDLLVKIGLKHPFIEIPEVLLKARSHSEQGSLTLGHLKEVEHFFAEHIPLLSAEYMSTNFRSQESIDAFLALGKQMCDRHFPNALLTVAKQLIYCEAQRAEPESLWQAIYQLTIKDYSVTVEKLNIQTDQHSSAPYTDNKLKVLARRWLPPQVRIKLQQLRYNLRHILLSSQPATQENEKTRLASLDFEKIYENNGFAGTESRSGEGSSLFQTRIIREEIIKLLDELEVKYLLDVPCGDWNWMRYVNLSNIYYTGGDIVQTIIDNNNKLHGNENCKFEYLNIITGPLPKADLILCRDCLVHLNFIDGLTALEQFRKSGAKWLLTTTFTERDSNTDLYEGAIWRPLNLEKPPYNLPKAHRYINEGCTEGGNLFGDKCLGLWQLN
ncbi:glycosyltransferase [Dolichospermum sp. UHCC 0684]|jgi:glycosyltransferase involved in cell wall biosynthesis|nr:glycosyltransferase [Dolichospermum sp. UHCC 0684]AFW95216.1 putative two-domain glycosyltransferase [Anabaena sp. 90]MEA5528554.1 glycosyltransferase [Dolichospermum sp. UHCC 0684]MTJ34516.1 glycosyltransferase [Dolichospermum sp. UHCC 0260]